MKLVLSHPTGNANVRAILSALVKKEMLAEFNTTIAVKPDDLLMKILPRNLRKQLLRRTYDVPKEQIHTYPFLEAARMLSAKTGSWGIFNRCKRKVSIDSVYQNFDLNVSKRLKVLKKKHGITGVYAYEDGALETFKVAKDLDLKCFYDLPIAYWETIRLLLKEEAVRWPHWAHTLGGGINDPEEKLKRKIKELELADSIIVPSAFVSDSLPVWTKKEKVICSPFGSPFFWGNNDQINAKSTTDRPLKVLFAGSLTQRKGLADLFEAFRIINRKDIQLVLLGLPASSMEFYKKEFPDFIYEPVRPFNEVLDLMKSCDVFCLPSIAEGRALVIQEAMSQGLPVIITPNTGGADLVKEGVTGFLVQIRSPEIIAEKLTWFLENRSCITEMGKMAQIHAAEYTWGNYATRIVTALDNSSI